MSRFILRLGAVFAPLHRIPRLVAPWRFAAMLGVTCALACAAQVARATPFLPPTDATVLEALPDGTDPGARALRAAHAALARNPHDLALAIRVAQADLDRAREAGDPRWLGRGEAAIDAWPQGEATPPQVTLLRATILQSNHDFAAARALLHTLLANMPSNGQGWLTLASIDLVQGYYSASVKSCGELAGLVLGLAPDTCTASVMALRGLAPRALKALDISLKVNAAEPVPVRLWAATLAAQIAERLGDPSADARYRAARALNGSDPYLLGAYSDFLLAQGRAAEVAALLRDKTRIDPLLLRLALAEQALHSPALGRHLDDLAQRFEAARQRGDSVHRREEARFELQLRHDAPRALALAQANWTVQREPDDAIILLQAAFAAARPQAAAPVRAWAQNNHLQDVRIASLLTAIATQGRS